MRDLDETDLEILQLLMGDARRPWSEIADVVDLSAPAVADRVERLREVGLIRRFTLDVDRSKLREGVPVLVHLDLVSGSIGEVREVLVDAEAVEHVFATAEGDLVFQARVPDGDVPTWLTRTFEAATVGDAAGEEAPESTDEAAPDEVTTVDATGARDASATLLDASVRDYEVTLLTDAEWTPSLGGTGFALDCAECGNTVTSEGVASRIGGTLYQFCCSSCEARFEEQYERLQAGVEN
jgi:DNA-binding Lrp family transcriptional regulator/YHS domain-containing protein